MTRENVEHCIVPPRNIAREVDRAEKKWRKRNGYFTNSRGFLVKEKGERR